MSLTMVDISIFGSCVTRDIFNFDQEKMFRLNKYIARQSMFSAVAEPVRKNIDLGIKSPFQERQVLNDFKKTTFDQLQKNDSEWIILDLIDERLPLCAFDNTVITLSSELVLSDYYQKHEDEFCEKKVHKISNWKVIKQSKKIKGYTYIFDDKLIDDFMRQFCNLMLERYRHIIIHRAHMMDYYLDKEKKIKKFTQAYLINNRAMNERLDYMYDFCQNSMPQAMILDMGNQYFATANHRWGLAPMHYQEEYYIDALYRIKKLIKENK